MEEKTTPETESKKKNGCLIAFFIFIGILALLAGGIYLAYKKVSKISLKKDLEVTYTEQDAYDILEELGTNVGLDEICMDCEAKEFGEYKDVEFSASNAQASAVVSMINQELPYGSISDSQIKFNDDGSTEWSTNFTYEGRTYPVYLKGTFEDSENNTVVGNLAKLSAGPVSLPENLNGLVENFLVDLANQKIQEYGIEINELSISQDSLNFDGKIPTEIK